MKQKKQQRTMNGRCTVFVADAAWRVACAGEAGVAVRVVDAAADAELSVKARAAANLIDALGGAGPVVVALPSAWCLTAAIATDGLGRGARRQAMAYLLEEHLPLSAEDAVADFAEHRDQAMGVCAELGRLGPLIEALENESIQVAHLCPAALLAAADYAQQQPEADGVFVSPSPDESAAADLIQLERGAPRRWWWLTDADALRQQLDALRDEADGAPLKLATNARADRLPDAPACEWLASEPADADAAAASHAARLLAGDVAAWIDLRRDALAAPGRYQAYQRPAARFAAAVALLLVCVIGVTFWRTAQYRQQADAFTAAQTDVYKQAFPDARRVPPVGVHNRMVSELRKLEGVGGQAANRATDRDAEPLHPTPALTHLHAVLSALPSNQPESMRYQIQSLSIQPGKVRVDGRAISSVVPEQLANALRQTGRYDVDPPSPRLLGDASWGYDFEARPIAQPQTQTPAEVSP